ncbi:MULTISPECIES: cation:proton antiporter [Acidobacteriaceae]|uniref:cation:proton antiporter domain-containing protein n=1 Tax=Acidobacteriaceae TaxID=204434 RepID=UPI00131C430B|nr:MULTISPECIES: cation:proton antiporter [Acidobacteriaceae]MDW5264199.1 cation:proton antiporter [Edaphobacter sp.]
MTLTLTNFLGLLGGLLVLAFVTNRFSRRTRVPDVIVLLICGIVLGPVLHWINADRFPELIRGVGTVALILILFAAGLELDLRRALKQFTAGMTLAIFSYGLTFAGVAYFCIHALSMARMPSLLVAAALACMSSSIILPTLDQLDLRHDLKTTLVIEASFGDGLGAIGVGVLLGLAGGGSLSLHSSSGAILGSAFAMFIFKFLLAFIVAIIAGFLWVRLLPSVSDKQFWQVLTFAVVLIVYSITDAIGGSALFAVMVFGATLASLLDPQNSMQRFGFEILAPGHSDKIHSFHSELAFLVRSFFFVLLGAMIQFAGLKKQLLPSLGILGVFLVARILAVFCSRIVWRGTTYRECEFATLLIPRGLITAVLALEVIQAAPTGLAYFPSLTFALILFTNVLILPASIRARVLAPASPPTADELPVS